MTRARAEMAILLDVGSAWAKASVVGRCRGRWRIVAHASQPRSWGPWHLWRTLARRLAPSADPRLAGELETQLSRATRIECHTARRPGRLVLAAVADELSATTARRAAEAAGWLVVETATNDDGRRLVDRLAALEGAEADAWLLAGGFDERRSEQALGAASLAAAARGRSGGPVVWAGSSSLADEVQALFEPGVVAVVPNIRPAPRREEPEPLRRHLEALLRRTVEPDATIHLAPVALRRAVGELARRLGLSVRAVDLGARYSTCVDAGPDGGVDSRIFAAGGLSAPALATTAGVRRVAHAMADGLDEPAIADALRNLAARPDNVPQTHDELAVAQAAARVQIAATTEGVDAARPDLLIGCGRVLAAAPRPAQAAQMLLDGARPLGVTQLALDATGALPPVGTLDDAEIDEGIDSLRDDLLVPLGTAVVCRGVSQGQVAMRVTVHRAGWPDMGPVEVRAGQIRVVPLPRGQAAELAISLAGGTSLGQERRAREVRAEVIGGAVGLILDARGVPVALPRRAEDRRAVQALWRDALLREPAAVRNPAGVAAP